MNNRMNAVLIVEDEQHIADLLQTNLALEGFETIVCSNGKDALHEVKSRHIDIILLDVLLPDCNGVDLCRTIKHSRSDIPIIMLSALGQSADRIKGLKSGADDYLPKPFDLEELFLRMSKQLQRSGNDNSQKILKIGEARADFESYTLTKGTEVYNLTSKEAMLLKYMTEKNGQALSRQNILDEVWGFEQYPNTRTIDNFIANLRKYVEEDPNDPKIITTIRGVGYKLSI